VGSLFVSGLRRTVVVVVIVVMMRGRSFRLGSDVFVAVIVHCSEVKEVEGGEND